jgi:hypothetical protein
MFYKEKCDLCGKCLEFCPYFDYDQNRAQKEMKDEGMEALFITELCRRALG